MVPLRPLLAAAVVVTILGSVYAYTQFLNHLHAKAQAEARARERELAAAAEGRFEVEIIPTFAAEVDAFSAEQAAASLSVRLGGSQGPVLLRRTDAVPAGAAIRFVAPGVTVGPNVFYVETSPRLEDSSNAAALHLRIFRGGTQLAEKTLWADPGHRLGGALEVDVPAVPGTPTHEH